jgi:hypothetical protein
MKNVNVDVIGRERRTTTREVARKVSQYGQRTVTRVTTEITDEPYVILSCGHEQRGADFDARGRLRRRVQCWACSEEAEA